MPKLVQRTVTTTEVVRVPCGTPATIFQEAFAVLRQAVLDTLPLPDKALIQSRIDRANNQSHLWNLRTSRGPFEKLREQIQARLAPLLEREVGRPDEHRWEDRQLLRWQTALTAVDAILASDMVTCEELLNQARAYWSRHARTPNPRKNKRGAMSRLKRQNAKLRAQLAAAKKR